MFERIKNQLIGNLKIESKRIGLDRSGFSSDYTKSHIAIDVESRMILYSQVVRGPKHDINS